VAKTKKTRIGHPGDKANIIWKHPSDTKAKFIAHGRASVDVVGGHMKAKLLKNGKTDTGTKTYLTTPTPAHPFWVIIFTGVDPTGAGEYYDLHIYDSADRLAHSDKLTVQVTKGERGITLIYPDVGGTVCPFFAAYGRYDSGSNVSCQLNKVTDSGTITVPATQMQISQGLWVASFVGVSEDEYTNIEAWVDSDPHLTNNTITVNDSSCSLETGMG
jgi:hypothetical protein